MVNASTTPTSCPPPMKATSNGVFQGDSPLDYALPLAILQICLVVVLTRGLAFLLRPLRQPRVIAEIIVSLLRYLINLIEKFLNLVWLYCRSSSSTSFRFSVFVIFVFLVL